MVNIYIKRRKRPMRVDFNRLATYNHRGPEVMVSKITRHNSEKFDFPAVCIVFL